MLAFVIVSVAPPAGSFLYTEFCVLLKADTFTRPLIGNSDASGGKTGSKASEPHGRVSALMLPDSRVPVDGWMSARFPSLTHLSPFPGEKIGTFAFYRGSVSCCFFFFF